MAEPYTDSERREHPRLEAKMSILHRTAESLDTNVSVIKNISGGGLCFETDVAFSPGDVLDVEILTQTDFRSKETVSVYALAEARWINQIDSGKYELGVKFVYIKRADREKISNYVQENLEQSGYEAKSISIRG